MAVSVLPCAAAAPAADVVSRSRPDDDGPLRIVHVLTRLLRAGSEENTVATALWQAGQGHRVTLVHGGTADPSWPDILEAGAVELVALPALVHPVRPIADLRATAALRALYRACDPDVIHTHQSKAGILGRRAADAVPAALVVHGQHILPFAGQGMVLRQAYILAERMAARRTDLTIAVSPGVAAACRGAGIGDPARLVVVPSGMDLAPFRAARPPADAESLRGTGPVLLMLAAFEPRKRHRAFLDAFRLVLRAHPGARLLLAGAGPEEAAVRAHAARLDLDAAVRFLGHRPDPAALLAMADVSVLASAREGLPRVIVQSLAAGCPVVTTALPGIEDIVTQGVNGLVTDARDLSRTARALAGLLGDPAALARLRQGAAATDLSAWDIARLGPDTTAAYRRAMAARAGRAPA
jgi:glycosyltransferase involved in cell wall biosynthesis